MLNLNYQFPDADWITSSTDSQGSKEKRIEELQQFFDDLVQLDNKIAAMESIMRHEFFEIEMKLRRLDKRDLEAIKKQTPQNWPADQVFGLLKELAHDQLRSIPREILISGLRNLLHIRIQKLNSDKE